MIKKKSRIFLAGHKGLVGSAILKKLNKNYPNILTVDRKRLDLRDNVKVNRFFKKKKIDIIIIAAAKAGGILANSTYQKDFFLDNINIQNNLLSLAFKKKVKRTVLLKQIDDRIKQVKENIQNFQDIISKNNDEIKEIVDMGNLRKNFHKKQLKNLNKRNKSFDKRISEYKKEIELLDSILKLAGTVKTSPTLEHIYYVSSCKSARKEGTLTEWGPETRKLYLNKLNREDATGSTMFNARTRMTKCKDNFRGSILRHNV